MTTAMDKPTQNTLSGQYPDEVMTRVEGSATDTTRTNAESMLMEAVVDRTNMKRAYDRVLRNKGAGGVDGLGVSELGALVRQHWPVIKAKLLDGTYQPQPVRRVMIPKPNGGERALGIPTVLDRLIQQALHQVLSPLFEPTFSDHSYGFRPGRNAHQAVKAAQAHVSEGYDWVVDLDIEQFFDRVDHEILMQRVSRVVLDQRVLKLIRKYLKVGAQRAAARDAARRTVVSVIIQYPTDRSRPGA